MSKRLFYLFKKYKQFEDDVWGDLYIRRVSTTLKEFFVTYFTERYRNNGKALKFKFGGDSKFKNFFFFDVMPEKSKSKQRRFTERGLFIMERLKLKLFYGNLTERQLRMISKATVHRKFTKYQNQLFLLELESRLDAVVFRMQIVPTIFAARQFVMHGNCCVNGQIITLPSFRMKKGDVFTLTQRFLWGDILLSSLKNLLNKRKKGTFLKLYNKPNYHKVSFKFLFLYFEKRPSHVTINFPFKCRSKEALNMYFMQGH